jgi:hypothetical protein
MFNNMSYSQDFLFIEFFNRKNVLTRLRYKVKQWSFLFPRVQITERGQRLDFQGRKSRKSFILVDSHTSESDLFEDLRSYVSEKYGVSNESIIFRWENKTLKMRRT